MPVTACFKADQLKSFALGRLNDEQAQQVAAHLQKCADCEQTLAGFDDTNDSLMLQIRSASAMAGAEECPAELERALGEIATSRTNTERPAFKPTGSNDDWVRDYRLLEQLGQGGMGTVYKAIHERLQRTVALKLLPAKRLRNNEAVGRFEREMRAIGRLDHPAIVRATDAGEVDGTHFLAMDYVPGIDVSKVVRLIGPLRVPDACEIVRQAAIGLSYAHGQGLIHRDVKPSNIMLALADAGEDVSVKLLDLGLALFGAASEAVDDFTTVGQLMGTLDYMAPEQADHSRVDQTADVYSLGSTLFKLLTGKAPFETGEFQTPLQKMKALATVEPPSLLDRPCEASAELAAVVDQMVQRDPKQRIPTAAEVATAVQPFCEGHALRELAQRAMELNTAAEKEAESRIPESIKLSTPGSIPEVKQQPMTPVLESAGSFDGSGQTRWLAGFAAVPLLALLAGVIWIQTDKGTLKIESIADDIPIEIRQGTQLVESLILKSGPNEILLRSGQHEVSISAKYDNLTMSNDTVEIERGGQTIVRIEEVKNDATNPAASSSIANPLTAAATQVPVFEGKTYDQWKALLEFERSPVERRKAIEALAALCNQQNTASTCELILSVLNQYSYPTSQTGSVDEFELFVSGVRVIREMDPDVVAEVLLKNLKTDRPNSNRLIVGVLSSTGRYGSKGSGNPYPLYRVLESNTQYVNAIAECNSQWRRVEHSREGQLSRMTACSNFLTLATNQAAAEEPLSKEVVRCCEAILQDEDSWNSAWLNGGQDVLWGKAAFIVTTVQPRAEVLKRLAGIADTDWYVWRALAIPNRHFESVLPVLAKQLGTLSKRDYQIGNEHFRQHQSTFAVEVFGLAGSAARDFLTALESEITYLTGQSVSPNGLFEFRHDYQPRCAGLTAKLDSWSADSSDNAAAVKTHFDALLWAYEKIAGHPAKFDSPELPRFDEFDFETRPTLASYKGRSIAEWARFVPGEFESWPQEQERLKVLRLPMNNAAVQAEMNEGHKQLTRYAFSKFHDREDWYELVFQLIEQDDPSAGDAFEDLFANATQPQQESLFLNVLTRFSAVPQPQETQAGANLPKTLLARSYYPMKQDEESQSHNPRGKIDDIVSQLVINLDKTSPAVQPEILRALTIWPGKLSDDAIGKLKTVFSESSELGPLAALTLGKILPEGDTDRSAVIDALIEAVATGDHTNAYWINAAASLAQAIQGDVTQKQLERMFEIMADSESSKSYTVLLQQKRRTAANMLGSMIGGNASFMGNMTGLESLKPTADDTQALIVVSRRSLIAEAMTWSPLGIQGVMREENLKRLSSWLSGELKKYRTSSGTLIPVLVAADSPRYFLSIAPSEESDEEPFAKWLFRLMMRAAGSSRR